MDEVKKKFHLANAHPSKKSTDNHCKCKVPSEETKYVTDSGKEPPRPPHGAMLEPK